MVDFIEEHKLWLTPITSVILMIIIKIERRPSNSPLAMSDWLDFGYDLMVSSLLVIICGVKDMIGGILIAVGFAAILLISPVIHRIGWDTKKNEPNLLGMVVPDIIGVIFVVGSVLYIGGKII